MNVSLKLRPVINFTTTRFGHLSVSEDKVIYFVKGLPGFGKLRRFILIDHDQDGLFKWLQSVDDPAVAFLLTNPNIYKVDYSVPLRKLEADALGVKKTESMVTLVTVCVSEGSNQMSLNLKGPIVFNSDNMKAMQCIIDRDDYPTHYDVKVS